MKIKNQTNIKRFIAFAASLMLAVSFASCGSKNSSSVSAKEPDNITEEDFEKAAEKLDNMTEEDLEKAAEKLEGGSAETEKKEEPAEEEKPEFEPTDEIKNADFTSGLIQIGNDVFKCGGYMTLREFVEKYGENWDCSGIDLDAPIPTEILGDNKKPDVYYFEIPNKEKNERTIYVAYYVAYNSIVRNKEAIEEYQSKDGSIDTKKAEAFAPFVYMNATRDTNTLKLYKIDSLYKTHEYPEGSSLGDVIVYDVRPNEISKQITFYPKGMTWATEGSENFVLDFYKANSNAENILDKDTFKNLLDTNKEKHIKLPVRWNTVLITSESSLYVNNMLNNQIIQWSLGDKGLVGEYDDSAFSYNIQLKDKNLLGFEPLVNLVILSNASYSINSIRYSEYQLDNDAITFTYGFNEDNNTIFIKNGGKTTAIS